MVVWSWGRGVWGGVGGLWVGFAIWWLLRIEKNFGSGGAGIVERGGGGGGGVGWSWNLVELALRRMTLLLPDKYLFQNSTESPVHNAIRHFIVCFWWKIKWFYSINLNYYLGSKRIKVHQIKVKRLSKTCKVVLQMLIGFVYYYSPVLEEWGYAGFALSFLHSFLPSILPSVRHSIRPYQINFHHTFLNNC